MKKPFVIAVGIWGTILAVLSFGPIRLSRQFAEPLAPAMVLAAAGIAYVLLVFVLFKNRRPRAGLIAMGTGLPIVIALVWSVYLPVSSSMRLSIRVGDFLKSQGVTGANQVIMLDYKEPTLAFYQGGTIRENSRLALTDALLDASPRWLVITRDVWNDPKTTASARERLVIAKSFDGLAYADGGRRVEVLVVRKDK